MTTLPSINLRLNWTRSPDGTTAILRRIGAAWEEVIRTTASEYVVRGLAPDTAHEFAAGIVLGDGVLSNPDTWRRLSVAPMASTATPARPAAPTRFAAIQDAKNVLFRWAQVTDELTKTYEIRTGASWEDGVLVARDIQAAPYVWAWWSSGSRTFWLKAIDAYGRNSLAAASVTVTISPLVDHVAATELDENDGGTWGGARSRVEVNGDDELQIEALPACFGAATDPFGSFDDAPCFAKYFPEGTYESGTISTGQLETERLEVDIGASQPTDTSVPFGSVHHAAIRRRRRRDGTLVPLGTRGIAARNSWRFTPLDPVDVDVEIDTAPAASGDWDGYRPFVPGTYSFWRCRFRVTLRGDGIRFVKVPTFTITHRRFNKKAEGEVEIDDDTGTNVLFPPNLFVLPPVVTCSVVGSTGPYSAQAFDITRTGCKIKAWGQMADAPIDVLKDDTTLDVDTDVVSGTTVVTAVSIDPSSAGLTLKHFDPVTGVTVHWHALGP